MTVGKLVSFSASLPSPPRLMAVACLTAVSALALVGSYIGGLAYFGVRTYGMQDRWFIAAALAILALGKVMEASGRGGRSLLRDVLSLAFGVASMALGMLALALFAYGVHLRLVEEGMSFPRFLFLMTRPRLVLQFLGVALIVAIPGSLGWLGSRGAKVGREKVTLAASARRFSLCGLALAFSLVALCAAGVAYRLYNWGWASLNSWGMG